MKEINLSDVIPNNLVILNHEPFQNKEKMFDMLSKKFEKSGIVPKIRSRTDAEQKII